MLLANSQRALVASETTNGRFLMPSLNGKESDDATVGGGRNEDRTSVRQMMVENEVWRRRGGVGNIC